MCFYNGQYPYYTLHELGSDIIRANNLKKHLSSKQNNALNNNNKQHYLLMKRLLILFFVAMATISMNGQTYYGYLTRNVDGYKKGEGIMNQKRETGRYNFPMSEYMGAYLPNIVKLSRLTLSFCAPSL